MKQCCIRSFLVWQRTYTLYSTLPRVFGTYDQGHTCKLCSACFDFVCYAADTSGAKYLAQHVQREHCLSVCVVSWSCWSRDAYRMVFNGLSALPYANPPLLNSYPSPKCQYKYCVTSSGRPSSKALAFGPSSVANAFVNNVWAI